MKTKNSVKGIVFLLTAAVVWGFAFVAQRVGGNVPAFTFNASRYVLGTLSLIPVIALFEGKARDRDKLIRTLKTGTLAGAFIWIASYLQQMGVVMTDYVGKCGFITGLYMILVPIFGLFLGRKTNLWTWIGAVLGVVGLFFICMSGGALTFTVGDILLILCAVFFAGQILVIDRYIDGVYPFRFSMIQFAVCAILNILGAVLTERARFSVSALTDAAIPILYCGILSVGVAYTCQVLGQRYSEPVSASILLSTESVFSAVGGALILHERMAWTAYLGCALIFAGILLSQKKSWEIMRKNLPDRKIR